MFLPVGELTLILVQLMVVEISSIAFGLFGLLLGSYAWWHARRWSHALQDTRMAITYKNKVKRNHSFAEWLQWGTDLTSDTKGGNVIYSLAGTHIAIFRIGRAKKRPRQILDLVRRGKVVDGDDK